MKFFMMATLAVAAVVLAAEPPAPADDRQPAATQPAATQPARWIEATVTGISGNHGNVYTNIKPDQYQALGLAAGGQIRVVFGQAELTLPIGPTYTAVEKGQPLAVLHREGLTFAIRDGNFSREHGVAARQVFRFTATPPAQ